MSPTRIHTDQITIDESLVRRLIRDQFPQWASLPVTPVSTHGTENAIYRLGDGMGVRLPYRRVTSDQLDKLDRWLPKLATLLPLSIPEPLARGVPSHEYPAAWSIVRWLDGQEAALERMDNPVEAAQTLAGFVRALMAADPTGGPAPGTHNFWRGVPLAARDAMTRRGIQASHGMIDTKAVLRIWERALETTAWDGPPTWLHGDLAPDNMLVKDGCLHAVIDWGGLGIGDPATELLPAWNLFRGASRDTYRRGLGFDDATWVRGRGLALSIAVVALPYYRRTIPIRAERALDVIHEVLMDQSQE